MAINSALDRPQRKRALSVDGDSTADDHSLWKLVSPKKSIPTNLTDKIQFDIQTGQVEDMVAFFNAHPDRIAAYRPFVLRDGLAEQAAKFDEGGDCWHKEFKKFSEVPVEFLWAWCHSKVPEMDTNFIKRGTSFHKDLIWEIFEFATGIGRHSKWPKGMSSKTVTTMLFDGRLTKLGNRLHTQWFLIVRVSSMGDDNYDGVDWSKGCVWELRDVVEGSYSMVFGLLTGLQEAPEGVFVPEGTKLDFPFSDLRGGFHINKSIFVKFWDVLTIAEQWKTLTKNNEDIFSMYSRCVSLHSESSQREAVAKTLNSNTGVREAVTEGISHRRRSRGVPPGMPAPLVARAPGV